MHIKCKHTQLYQGKKEQKKKPHWRLEERLQVELELKLQTVVKAYLVQINKQTELSYK